MTRWKDGHKKSEMATSVLQPEEYTARLPSPSPSPAPAPECDADWDSDSEAEAEERARGELPEALRESARAELREEPRLRDHALAQMRHFIEKHRAIKNCRTDAPFLLRFLRTKKYSVPQACAMLEKYLAIRQAHPQWFHKLDPLDPKVAAVIDAGYLVPLPVRDAHGRKIILSCIGRFDPHAHDSSTMARVHSMVVELLMDSPRSQLHGYTYVNDEAGLTMPHISLWSLKDIRTMLNCIQNSTPMRHKTTHFVNIPHYGAKVIEFSVSMLSDKLRERVMVHRSNEELVKHVSPALLPAEYGGAVPLRRMVERLKRDLLAHRRALLALDDMSIDLEALGRADLDRDLHSTAGSFRKLELD